MQTDTLNWPSLIFGSYSHAEVKACIGNVHWQTLRQSLLGTTLEEKYAALQNFVGAPVGPPLELRHIVVTNYVHSLARGGLIPPCASKSALIRGE